MEQVVVILPSLQGEDRDNQECNTSSIEDSKSTTITNSIQPLPLQRRQHLPELSPLLFHRRHVESTILLIGNVKKKRNIRIEDKRENG
mmetsp:Transcript_49420/g.50235  ORF Transcript_49420/g.50235 Transcript_49420/m.50235 type:complete len:88 (+) Transcript_49420:81-344(+)